MNIHTFAPEVYAETDQTCTECTAGPGVSCFPDRGVATCDHCGSFHGVEYHHDGQFGEGPIYGMWAIDCPQAAAWVRDDGTPYDVTFVTVEALWGLA